jgi:hypothetical protein
MGGCQLRPSQPNLLTSTHHGMPGNRKLGQQNKNNLLLFSTCVLIHDNNLALA